MGLYVRCRYFIALGWVSGGRLLRRAVEPSLKMQSLKTAKIWFLEIRPRFLILPATLAFLGTSIARLSGPVHIWPALLGHRGGRPAGPGGGRNGDALRWSAVPAW